MGFPDKKHMEEALKNLEGKEGTLALPKNASPLEKFRWELCQNFIRYKRKNGIAQEEMANLLEVDEAEVSKFFITGLRSFPPIG